jgi:hypothetical protein
MNQSDEFISDRENGIVEWITIDEACRKSKEERLKIARLIWKS